MPSCVYGDPDGTVTVSLVGDSHAAQWQPTLQAAAEQRHWRLRVFSKVTCPVEDLPINSPHLGRRYTECERWRSQVLDELRAHPPAAVVLSESRRYGADFGFTIFDASWVAGLGRTVSTVRATGAQVLVLGPVPDPHAVVPTCLSRHLDSVSACSPPRPSSG
jgi:hypothetical protein